MNTFKKAALAMSLAGLCTGAFAAMSDGTFEGTGQGRNGDIVVQMTVRAARSPL